MRGPNLRNFKHLKIFFVSPSVKVTRLLFPDCADGNPKNYPVSDNRTCNFQENEIIKAAWPGLKRYFSCRYRLITIDSWSQWPVGII